MTLQPHLFKAVRRILHIACCLLAFSRFCGEVAAQSSTLVVVDSLDGTTIPDVQATYRLGGTGAWQPIKADVYGGLTLPVEPGAPFTLQIRHIGYQPRIVKLVATPALRISLMPDGRMLDPVVVTAQARPRASTQTLVRVRVIDQAQVRAQGATNLRELLSQQLGVQLQQDGVLGTGIRLNGLSGQHIKIMVDGVPVVGRSDGQLDLSQLNLSQVEAVEIVEGPLSVEYGSDALGGTINLITRQGGQGTWQPHASAYWESVGSYNAEAGIRHRGRRHSLAVQGGRYFFDGFSPVDTSRDQLWNPKEQYLGGWQYGLKQPAWRMLLKGNYYEELITDRGALRAPYFETAFDARYRTWRIDHAAQADGRLGRGHHWEAVAGINQFSRRNNQYFKDLTTLVETLTPSENQDTNWYYQGMSRGHLATAIDSSRLQWKLGYDWRTEIGIGPRIANRKKSLTDLAGFASAEYRLATWMRIQVGMRYGYNSAYAAPLSPSLNVWLRPSQDWIVRVAAARGFRAPSIKELYLAFQDINHDISGNPDLRAEYSYHLSVAPSYQHLFGQTLLRAEASLWLNSLRDQISLVQSADQGTAYTYINLQHVRAQGARASLGYLHGSWQGELGANLLGTTSGLDIPHDPARYSWEGNIRLQYKIPKVEVAVSAFYKFTSKRPVTLLDSQDQLVLGSQAAYHWLDLSASRSFLGDRLHVTLGGKNLLDIRNLSATASTGGTHSGAAAETPLAWGRSAFLQLNYDLQQ